MTSTHGKVIARDHAYQPGRYLHLQMSDGNYAAIPVGLECKAGEVVAVLTPHELKLIKSYRDNIKPKQKIEP